MRVLMLLAVVCLVVAFVCASVPTLALGDGWQSWVTGGLIFWAIDVLLGGWAAPIGVRRTP